MEAVLAFLFVLLKFSSCLKNDSVYLGCFRLRDKGKIRENDPADVIKMPENLTAVNCALYCLVEKDWQYFGTTIGSRCYCWTSTAGFQHYTTLEETFCNEPCPGNKSEICGGRDGISIYGDAARSCQVISISNGQATKEGSSLIFTCDEGYQLKGNQTLHCDKGGNFSKILTWQGDIPICTGMFLCSERYRFSSANTGFIIYTRK
ncbi:hypothetical protein HOLleu_23420 [Holothuria leucospilota]|uniref:Uncharacterized protein n=1 Tax=Holothuria leucospilota TaxID=206669 RepID=A0A9Q1BV63_HOLLE|nr:hypothetical protein HOLleu_23420 [Holothuria leucospilota]